MHAVSRVRLGILHRDQHHQTAHNSSYAYDCGSPTLQSILVHSQLYSSSAIYLHPITCNVAFTCWEEFNSHWISVPCVMSGKGVMSKRHWCHSYSMSIDIGVNL